jgi:glycosyltransferase involved in cell wall biosynthesis
MRVLYASERPPYPFFLGGAARCAHQILSSLSAELNVQCAAVGSADYSVTPWSIPALSEHAALGIASVGTDRYGTALDCGYPVRTVPNFERTLKDLIADFRPDILWTQLEGSRPLLELARDLGIRGLYFVHDAETPAPELRAIGRLDCHVVCSSGFLARRTQAAIGRPAHLIYPSPQLYFDTTGDPQGCVTMINPVPVKGIETFLEIARQLPAERFLLVESWKLNESAIEAVHQRLASLANVTFQRRVSDMRAIYSRTRLLIVPSVWEEGFGMVAVEAQSCGIPVIASARGGLPESIGDGGVLIEDYRDPAAWVRAIGGVLDDPEVYRRLAERAQRHARSDVFTAAYSARRMREICTGEVARASPYARGVNVLAEGLRRVPGLGTLLRQRPR